MPISRRQGRRAFRGTVILMVLVVLALAIFFLDRMGALLNRTYTVVAVSTQAVGVSAGSPVWVAGVPAGTVRRVRLLPPGDTLARVALDLELKRGIALQVRRDSHLRFATVRTVGETVIELMPGSARAPQLAENDTLPPIPPPARLADVSARARAVRLQLDSLMLDAAALRKDFALRGREMSAASRQFAQARRELADLQQGYRGGSLAHLMSLQAPDGPLAGVNRRMADVRRVMARSSASRAAFLKESAPDRQQLQGHLRGLQAEISALRRLTSQPVGTLGRMQSDSAFEKALAGTRARLDSLVSESKKHPWRYIF